MMIYVIWINFFIKDKKRCWIKYNIILVIVEKRINVCEYRLEESREKIYKLIIDIEYIWEGLI